MNGDFDISVLLEEFVEDAAGHLEAVESSLLELEREGSGGETGKAVITTLLGNLHTLKGNSGMMGFSQVQQYIHRLESVFKLLLDRNAPITADLFEVFYAAINSLRNAFATLQKDPAAPVEFGQELEELDRIMSKDAVQENETLPTEKIAAARESREFNYITQKNATLKVNFEKLDELLNLVGELVIHRTTLHTLETRLREKVTDRELVDAFNEASQLIGKSSTDLREAIMKARMLPVKTVFQRFQRLVRDLSHAHGKNVHLKFEGEETELDKTVIDEIGEPLLHLIRNAIDHGIESPSERKKKGKPPSGTLLLEARHESNHIVISVTDDGRGMSADVIRGSAIDKGVLDQDEAAAMTDAEALQLVFVPGFSTSKTVTETSGRGIGLDVVKKIVNSFNGMIDIDSRPGTGTTFTIKLPLTLAIITALMVEVSGETFAIPLSGVLESIRIGSGEIHLVGNEAMVKLRDRLLPVHRLDRFFGLDCRNEKDQEYVVVVGSGEKRGGLIVDRLIGQQEIVIKGLDEYLGDLRGISGGTVLGNGKISLILDIGSLLGEGKRKTASTLS